MLAKNHQGYNKRKHNKNYRQKEHKIRRIETTPDRLTGRAGLALFVAYMHGI